MRRVRSKGTTPELLVRQIVTKLGFRYHLNSKKLPGHPDLVFGRLRMPIIFCKQADFPWPVSQGALGPK